MDINLSKKIKIITLFQHTNKSKKEISTIVGVSRRSVYNIIKQWGTSGNVESKRKGRCGRKCKAGPEAMQMLIKDRQNNCI